MPTSLGCTFAFNNCSGNFKHSENLCKETGLPEIMKFDSPFFYNCGSSINQRITKLMSYREPGTSYTLKPGVTLTVTKDKFQAKTLSFKQFNKSNYGSQVKKGALEFNQSGVEAILGDSYMPKTQVKKQEYLEYLATKKKPGVYNETDLSLLRSYMTS